MRELTIEEQDQVGGGILPALIAAATIIGGVAALVSIWQFFKGNNGTVEVGPLKTLEDLGGKCIDKGSELEITIDGNKYNYKCTPDQNGHPTVETDGKTVETDENGNPVLDETGNPVVHDSSDPDSDSGSSGDNTGSSGNGESDGGGEGSGGEGSGGEGGGSEGGGGDGGGVGGGGGGGDGHDINEEE